MRCRRSGIEALRRCRRRCRARATTMSSWSSRAPAPPRKWRAMLDNWSAPPSRAASSCSPTPISKSTCHRSGSRSIASGGRSRARSRRGRSAAGILLAGDYVNRFTMDGRTYKVIPQVGACPRGRHPASRLQDPDPRWHAGAVLRGRPARDLGRAAHPGALPASRQFSRLWRGRARGDQSRGARNPGSRGARDPACWLQHRLRRRSRQIRQEGPPSSARSPSLSS